MQLTFCGAARTVTGSCYLLEAAGRRVLIDCGMFQGNREIRERNRERFGFKPQEIEAVLLTHAHIDHSGLLPKLTQKGFRGRIVATEATTDLCGIMLPDSAHIQEMDAQWRDRKAQRQGREPMGPLYTLADAQKTLGLFQQVKYGQTNEVFPGIKVRFMDAGHILGSSIIEIWVREGDRETKLVFSGDLGQRGAPIINDPTSIEEADYILVESTYGDRLHEKAVSRLSLLADAVKAAVKSGGNLIIPAFAVERTQELLYDIRQLAESGSISLPPVYIDSPLAVSATEIFRRHPDCYDSQTYDMINKGDSPFEFPGLTFVRTVQESQALNQRRGSAIIISANGMCEAGRILHHLKHNLWRPEAHLLFVGYQAEGTLGRRLLEGEKNARVMGEDIVVRAAIHNIGSYSAHADRDDLLAWLRGFKRKPRSIFLVHGEDAALANWSATVQEKLNLTPLIPAYGETYTLGEQAIKAVEAAKPAAGTDEWSSLLGEVEKAYRGLQTKLPRQAPVDSGAADKLRGLMRQMIEQMSKVS